MDDAEMRDVGSAPVGIPVQEFIDKSVLALAREMLLQQYWFIGIASEGDIDHEEIYAA